MIRDIIFSIKDRSKRKPSPFRTTGTQYEKPETQYLEEDKRWSLKEKESGKIAQTVKMEVHKPHEDVKTYYINYECNPKCRQDPKENIIANSLNKVLGSRQWWIYIVKFWMHAPSQSNFSSFS